MKNRWSDKVSNIKITEVDLERLSMLALSSEFDLLNKTADKFITMWKHKSFLLDETNPHFALEHNRFVERALGIKMFLKFIADSPKKVGRDDTGTN